MNIGTLSLKNEIFLAPMAGISDLPYRLIMKEMGAALVFSEMISANGLIRSGAKTWDLLTSDERERPLGIQLFGDDPGVLGEAARMVEEKGDLIDINMGCPVPKVVRSGAGSSLMRDPRRVSNIVSTIRKTVSLPLTVKIRSGWDTASINFIEIGKIAEAEGADAVILHPRTRKQGFGGEADWDHITRLKSALSIPVVGSGDIFTPEDAVRMLRTTGCDAVMIGRGGYGNPWLIRNILTLLKDAAPSEPSPDERCKTARKHLMLFEKYFGGHKAAFAMRKHLCWYSKGMDGSAHFRMAVNRCRNVDELQQTVTEFFSRCETNEEGHE